VIRSVLNHLGKSSKNWNCDLTSRGMILRASKKTVYKAA
jgi:hypothetical protein